MRSKISRTLQNFQIRSHLLYFFDRFCFQNIYLTKTNILIKSLGGFYKFLTFHQFVIKTYQVGSC